jgi:hypothetical protein
VRGYKPNRVEEIGERRMEVLSIFALAPNLWWTSRDVGVYRGHGLTDQSQHEIGGALRWLANRGLLDVQRQHGRPTYRVNDAGIDAWPE